MLVIAFAAFIYLEGQHEKLLFWKTIHAGIGFLPDDASGLIAICGISLLVLTMITSRQARIIRIPKSQKPFPHAF